MNKKTLIIDCDGVLYSNECISLNDFVTAVKKTAKDFNISDEKYNEVSEDLKKKDIKGLFNFVYALCDRDMDKFNEYQQRVIENNDYSKLEEDKNLLSLLNKTKENYDIVILTNNTYPHLDMVSKKRFGKSVSEIGIDAYGIEFMEYKGMFHPKQSQIGLRLFTDKIGVNIKNCILVDDTQRNIDVAKDMGMDGVLITEEFTLTKYLNSLNKPKINTLKQEYNR